MHTTKARRTWAATTGRAVVVALLLAAGLAAPASPASPASPPAQARTTTGPPPRTVSAPRAPGGFLPTHASRVDVVVAAGARDDVLAAALQAVATLSARYGPRTPVLMDLASSRLPRTGPRQRVVVVEPGPGPVRFTTTTRFGLRTLVVSGAGPALARGAAALAGPPAATVDPGPTVDTTPTSDPGTGFSTFPRALGGHLAVALRATGPARTRAAVDASLVVASLQDADTGPLVVRLVGADVFVRGRGDGLLVGATAVDAAGVGAPLGFGPLGLTKDARATFQVVPDDPYAALEAVHADGRDILLLGGWTPDAAPDADLRRRVAERTAAGWTRLDDDLLVASAGTPVFTVPSTELAPPAAAAATPSGSRRSLVVGGGLAAVLLALLIVVVQLVLARRRDRRERGGDTEPEGGEHHA